MPIIARLTLANRSAIPIPRYFNDNADFEGADAKVVVLASDGAKVADISLPGKEVFRLRLKGGPRSLLEPGASWQCERMFLLVSKPRHPGESCSFVQPGGYKVVAEVLLPEVRGEPPCRVIKSDPIDLTVTEAQARDAAAVRLLEEQGVAEFFKGRTGGQPEAITRLFREYPASTYARYARLRLILDRALRLWETKRSNLTPEQRKEAAMLLADALKFVSEFPDMPLSDNVLLCASRLQRCLGEKEKSAETLERIMRDYPNSDAREAAALDLGRLPVTRPSQPSPPVKLDVGGSDAQELRW